MFIVTCKWKQHTAQLLYYTKNPALALIKKPSRLAWEIFIYKLSIYKKPKVPQDLSIRWACDSQTFEIRVLCKEKNHKPHNQPYAFCPSAWGLPYFFLIPPSQAAHDQLQGGRFNLHSPAACCQEISPSSTNALMAKPVSYLSSQKRDHWLQTKL